VLIANDACGQGGGATASQLTDCEVLFNLSTASHVSFGGQGGGLYGGTATECTLRGNVARGAGPGAQPSLGGGAFGTVLERSVVSSNRAERGGGVAGSGAFTAVLERCTVFANSAVLGAGGGIADAVSARNSIVWHNFGGAFAGTATFRHCDVQGGAPGVGVIDFDPLVFGPAGSDAHLRAGSPCVDAGDPLGPLDPDGSLADLGAFPLDLTWAEAPAAYCRPTRPASAFTTAPNCVPRVQSTGAASVSGASILSVIGTEVTPGQLGILMIGRASNSATLNIGGGLTGTLCIGAPYVRGRVQAATPGVGCDGVLNQPIPPQTLAALGALPGDRLHAQFWYRAGAGTALTDALEIPILP